MTAADDWLRTDIGASTPEAITVRGRDLATELGADTTVDADAEDMTEALREANGGQRVDIVLDMTGGRITDQSLAALAPFGRLAFYGMANRQPPSPVTPGALLARSTTVGGMWLPHAFRIPGLVTGRRAGRRRPRVSLPACPPAVRPLCAAGHDRYPWPGRARL